MKRCFYIANSYDGAYFFLTDSFDEYTKKIMAYVVNLERSGKCNHYSFGSVEMTAKEYLEQRDQALGFESGRIQQRKEELEREQSLSSKVNKDKSQRPPLRLL